MSNEYTTGYNQQQYLGLIPVHAQKEVEVFEALKVFNLDQDLDPVFEYLNKFQNLTEAKAKAAIQQFKQNKVVTDELGKIPGDVEEFVSLAMDKWKYTALISGQIRSTDTSKTVTVDGKVLSYTDQDLKDPVFRLTVNHQKKPDFRLDKALRDLTLLSDRLNLKFNFKLIEMGLSKWLEVTQTERLKDLKLRLQFKPYLEEKGHKEITALVDLFCDQESRKLAVPVMKHFMWQVKRKMNRLPVYHQMMPVLIGTRQGTGKSWITEYITAPVSEVSKSSHFDAIVSDKEIELWENTFVMILDEMQGASKSDIDRVKNVITAKDMNRRVFHTQKNAKVEQQATFIGTTNEPLMQLVRDTTGNRRFFPIHVVNRVFDFDAIREIDMLTIWQSIDEEAESPIVAYLDVIKESQLKERFENAVMFWVKEFTTNDKWMSGSDLYQEFKSWAENNWSNFDRNYFSVRQFQIDMTKLSEIDNHVKKKRTNKGFVYLID